MKPQEIGDRFNVRDTAVSEASRRLVRTLETDEELLGRIEKIKGKLEKCRM